MKPRSPLLRRAGIAGAALLVLALLGLAVYGVVTGDGEGPVGASPAARVGDRVISADDLEQHRKLLHELYQAMEKDPSSGIPAGAVADLFVGRTERAVPMGGVGEALTQLVTVEAYRQVADAFGIEVTAEDRDQARSQVEQSAVAASAPTAYVDFLVGHLSRQVALQRVEVPEADVRAAYDEQKADYTQVCVQIVGVDDAAAAGAVTDRLEGGEPFDAVFADANTNEEVASINGEYPCGARADLAARFGDAVYEAEAGDVLPAVQAGESFWVVPQVRQVAEPRYEDIEAELRRQLNQPIVAERLAAVFDTTRVNPRFGTWDDEQWAVVPPAAPAEPSSATTTTDPAVSTDPAGSAVGS